MIKVSRTFHRCQYFLDEEEWDDDCCGVGCCRKRRLTVYEGEYQQVNEGKTSAFCCGNQGNDDLSMSTGGAMA